MKICIIAPTVIPILGVTQKYGGTECVIFNTSEKLTKRGHDVYVFASGDSMLSSNLVPTTPKALGQGVSFEEEKACNRRAYELAVARNPDVIWDSTLALHAQEIVSGTSKFIFKADIVIDLDKMVDTGNIPVVQTLHGPAKDHLPNIVNVLSKAGHYFVSISNDQASRYADFIEKGHHLGTVYNSVDIDFYTPSYKEKKNYVLWVGRYCMEKGAHLAIAAAKKIDMPIYLIGKKAEKFEIDYFDTFIEPLLGEKVKVLGMVAAEEKAQLMRDAKAIMMTNLWPEPFGLVVAEGMASGTPVVGPALGSLTEMIGDSGVLIPIDDLGLSEFDTDISISQQKYIERISDSIKLVDSIPSQSPRDRAVKLFSPKNNADGYEEAFNKAISLKK